MKKIGTLFVGFLFLTFAVLAGEVITNDTGEDAMGLHVTFSSPVLITAFGDILTSVDPQMLAFEFVFSGGVVEPWGSHWMNWAPTTAQIISSEWLTGSEFAPANLPVSQTIDHHVTLTSSSEQGATLSLVVRETIPEQIPLTVSYEIMSSSILMDEAVLTWAVSDSVSGAHAPKFVLLDEGPHAFRLDIVIDGETYSWEREALVLPLHDKTLIVCDVTGFGVDPEAVTSVEWRARNWEMGELATMTLTNTNSQTAILECTTPTFLDLECSIAFKDGTQEIFTVKANVYSRDGSSFDSAGVGFYLTDPADGLDAVMSELPRTLDDLNCDHIVVAIIDWYGEPANGLFRIHPLEALPNGEADPRGYTISTTELAAVVATAREQGFNIWIVLSASPYSNAGEWRNDYQGWAAGNNADYRLRSGFIEGHDGQGLRASFLRNLDFIVNNQDVISSVYLGAEWQYELTLGGARTAQFYGEIVDAFRNAGYEGDLSHACMTGTWGDEWHFERLVDPDRCGMPFQTKMNSVGTTFYSRLLMAEDEPYPGSDLLLKRAKDLTETIYTALHENYAMPVSIVDFYCLPSTNCLYYPTVWDISGPVNLEAFLQFHGTWLTALGEASRSAQSPWLSITVGLYRAIAESQYSLSKSDPFFSTFAWVNANFPNNRDYRRLLSAFFGDFPFSEYSAIEKRT